VPVQARETLYWNNTMRTFITICSTALLIFSIVACGGDDEESNNSNSNSNNSTPATIECGGTTCNTSTQYCVQTRVGSFDAPTNDFCLSKPASCTSCDCVDVKADFEAQQDGAGNCTGAIVSCGNTNGAISATCTKSSL
jgi:hypothetical protein